MTKMRIVTALVVGILGLRLPEARAWVGAVGDVLSGVKASVGAVATIGSFLGSAILAAFGLAQKKPSKETDVTEVVEEEEESVPGVGS